MIRVAEEHRLSFEVKIPNATTQQAMDELEAGKDKSFKSVKALMDGLNADNQVKRSSWLRY